MKKLLFTLFVSSVLFAFTGCELLLAMLAGAGENPSGENNTVNDNTVKSTLMIPLYDEYTDLTEYITDEDANRRNSKVYVVQLNMDTEIADSEDTGTLTSAASVNTAENRSAEDVIFEPDETLNILPDFVRNFKKPVLTDEFKNSKSDIYSRAAEDEEELEVGETNVFSIPQNSRQTIFKDYYCTLKYKSQYADVFYCPNLAAYDESEEEYLSDSDFEAIGKKFDQMYRAETNLMGQCTITSKRSWYIDNPPKITILINDIYEDSTPAQKSGTFGYFYGGDLYNKTTASKAGITSNEGMIVYIDSFFYKTAVKSSLTTLAHEFNHLINYINKEVNADTDQEEKWFAEMLSMVSEDLLYECAIKDSIITENTVIKNRIPYFNGSCNYGVTFREGKDVSQEETLAYYGNAFAFGSFLVRNYGGIELIHEIATNEYVNEDAIDMALETLEIPSPFYTSEDEDDIMFATFSDVLMDFASSVLNINLPANTKERTLNRKITGFLNGTKYTANAINIEDFYRAGPEGNKKIPGLKLYESKQQADLGSYGFMVQYAGTGEEIQDLYVTLPDENTSCNMFAFIQYFD